MSVNIVKGQISELVKRNSIICHNFLNEKTSYQDGKKKMFIVNKKFKPFNQMPNNVVEIEMIWLNV